MMTPTERILSALADRNCDPKQSGKGWSARCPAHEDRRPSLTIGEGDGGECLLDCKAGCDTKDVVAAIGRTMSDLFPSSVSTCTESLNSQKKLKNHRQPKGKPTGKTYSTALDAVAALDKVVAKDQGRRVAQWTYHDANGDPVAVVCRYDLPTTEGEKQQKTFRPVARCRDGWTIGGMPEPRPLYGLPDLAGADRVYICEGEKAADAARAIGLTATTSAHGSQSPDKTDWSPLADIECVILPDHDEPGRKYAESVAAMLAKLTPPAVVNVVNLPGLTESGDIVDWIDGKAAEPDELRRQIEALADAASATDAAKIEADASPQKAVIVCVGDVTAEPVRWMWPGRFALGKLSMIAGDPGLGKSLTTLDIAARVTQGLGWPDGSGAAPAGGVVLLNAEDDIADTIRPRLEAAGANVMRIMSLTAIEGHDANGTYRRGVDLSRDLLQIEAAILAAPDCRLVVIDPVSAYLGNKDSYNNAEIRSVLSPLSELASRHRVALLAVTHLRKGEGQAIYRAMGSLAFAAAARAVWVVTKDPDDESRRLLLPIKNNIAADTSGLAFKVTAIHSGNGQPTIEWERDTVTMTADHVLAGDARKPGPEADARAEATDFLTDALADGPRLVKDLETEAKKVHGISSRTLIRARKAAGIVAYRDVVPGPWWLRLPNDANPGDNPGLSIELGNLGTLALFSKEMGDSEGGETQGCQESQVIGNGAGGDDWGEL